MGLPQQGENGVGLSPHIQTCRPHHLSMARAVALGNVRPTELANLFGFSVGQVSRIMGSPAFQAEVRRLQQDSTLVELDMAKTIKVMSQRAVEVLDEDMELEPSTFEGRRIRQNAALEVLNIAGIRGRSGSGGIHLYLQKNDNRTYNVSDLSDDDIRDELLTLTKGTDGAYGNK